MLLSAEIWLNIVLTNSLVACEPAATAAPAQPPCVKPIAPA